jgi:hypothetical protein
LQHQRKPAQDSSDRGINSHGCIVISVRDSSSQSPATGPLE